MRVQIRIVSGKLRGRKLTCNLAPGMRPTPQMVREAFFSILGDAIPDRPFYDIFACSGAVGLEALSRGASQVTLVERDQRLAAEIDQHIRAFEVPNQAKVLRVDSYRWADRWSAPDEPVNVYISPPFADFSRRPEPLVRMLHQLQVRVAAGSVVVLQSENTLMAENLPDADRWELRRYGRNLLLIWVKPDEEDVSQS